MSNAFHLAEIPDELAAEAAQVPGLPKRLLNFLRAEVSQHRRRQSRYSPEAQQIAWASTEQAAALQAAGMKPADARAEFAALHAEVMKDLPGQP
jgi:23S rRNA maturation-related 3'-5' exoribonuclease YhaM